MEQESRIRVYTCGTCESHEVTTEGYAYTAAVRRKYFADPFPAATGVIVAGLLRPGALIEIDAIAKVPQ